jgi:hypothetical protein
MATKKPTPKLDRNKKVPTPPLKERPVRKPKTKRNPLSKVYGF